MIIDQEIESNDAMSKVETDTNSQCIHNKNKDKLSK